MIPKKIWQTYKTNFNDLPDYAMSAAETWINKNPDWQYNYMSDEDVMDFVSDNFGKTWLNIFGSCPLGVMRADIWRIMILYINGGMYTDLDTVCNIPASSWFNELSDKRVILNAEHEIHIQQWTFLSENNHPVFSYMLENIEEGFNNPDYSNPHFVHAMTGPGIFTKSILKFLDMWIAADSVDGEIYKYDEWAQFNKHKLNLINDVDLVNSSDMAKEYGIYLIPSHRFFHNQVSRHLYGSQSWDDGRYDQWIVERDKIV
jgi:mannosyltransferase OCH1-like enzyme